jgi:flagellar FliJ protein
MAKRIKKGKFRYNLETVLKVKHIREMQEKEKFAIAQRKADEERRLAEALKQFENTKLTELRAKFEAGQKISDFSEILMRRSHLDKVKKDIVVQDKKKVEAESLLQKQRDELVRAVKDKKVFEKDKDHKKDEWRKVMDKAEGEFLDEIATQRHVRHMDRNA